MRLQLITFVLVGAIAAPMSAQAADPAAVQTPIKGSDVMDGKTRPGPDGWSWAPQTRDQVPTANPSQAAAAHSGDPNRMPDPSADKTLKPGNDPGTPEAVDSSGPGTMDAGTAHKP